MSRRNGWGFLSLLALGFAAVLGALSFVTWRQARARETLAELDRIRSEIAVAEAEQTELKRRIQSLESRKRISEWAERELGMHQPEASEMVLLQGTTP
jgi:cell division protein FtsL